MKNISYIIGFLWLLLSIYPLQASIPLAPRMGADGKIDMFGCMQSNDYYIVNFAAYQTDLKKSTGKKTLLTPWCQSLPQIGETTIAIDLLDRDVRKKPVSLKIMDSNKQYLYESPVTEVKQGVITAKVNFARQGLYEVVLFIEDRELNIDPVVSALHIPLTVATSVPGPSATPMQWIWVIAGIALFTLLIGIITLHLSKSTETA